MPELKNRYINGYHQFQDPQTGRWEFTHRRVMEKKLRGPIPPGFEVHHINGDKADNRPNNLVAIDKRVHHRLHHGSPGACYRCGDPGHQVMDCTATRRFDGKRLRVPRGGA